MRARKLTEADVRNIIPQTNQPDLREVILANADNYIKNSCSVCLYEGDETVAVGGVYKIYPARGQIWVIFSDNMGTRKLLAATRIFRRITDAMLKRCFSRLEAYVYGGFAEGVVWAEASGFTMEAVLKRSSIFETDEYLMVRVRED